MDNLSLEASAFDNQIIERIKNGHIPDLRRSGRCEYFYNNVWRDQFYANLYFGEMVQKVTVAAKQYFENRSFSSIKILEVGCGPGHVCLELARNGFEVTGLDISSVCIEIAEKTAAEDPFKGTRGNLKYVTKDFLAFDETADIVLFTAALHHFPNTDEIIEHSFSILNKDGLIIADEPIRDHVSRKNAALIYFITTLIASAGIFYKDPQLTIDHTSIEKSIEKIYKEERYEMEDGSKVQSVNDNEAGFAEMIKPLEKYFQELELTKDFAIYHRMIGGLRMKTHKEEHKLSVFIKQMDSILCSLGALDPTNFTFIGRKANQS